MVSQAEKMRARNLTSVAIRHGRLIRAACETCGKTTGRIDAHHDDYTKPLSVRWLCRSCHQRHHHDGVDPMAIVKMHAGGKRTLKYVGDAFGITRERVRQILDREGVETRKGIAPADLKMHQDRVDRYVAALRPGVTSAEAARIVGASQAAIYKSASFIGRSLPKRFGDAKIRNLQIAAYYAAHADKTGREVASHFGVSQMTVSQALQATNTPSRRSGWSWKRSHEANLANGMEAA